MHGIFESDWENRWIQAFKCLFFFQLIILCQGYTTSFNPIKIQFKSSSIRAQLRHLHQGLLVHLRHQSNCGVLMDYKGACKHSYCGISWNIPHKLILLCSCCFHFWRLTAPVPFLFHYIEKSCHGILENICVYSSEKKEIITQVWNHTKRSLVSNFHCPLRTFPCLPTYASSVNLIGAVHGSDGCVELCVQFCRRQWALETLSWCSWSFSTETSEEPQRDWLVFLSCWANWDRWSTCIHTPWLKMQLMCIHWVNPYAFS